MQTQASDTVTPPNRRRQRDLLELTVGYGLILLVLWTPRPYQHWLYLVAAAFLIAASIRPGETRQGLGVSLVTQAFLPSVLIVILAAALGCVSVAFAAHWGVLHAPGSLRGLLVRFWGYAIWSFAQQFLLQNFFLLRFRRLLPQRTGLAITLSAAIFAAAHLPNPVLTVFTLVWGLIACAIFVRFRNLYPLGIAHAILGVTVAVCLPGALTHNMHVGLGYFRYRQSPPQRRVSDQTVSTNVWVTADAPTR